VLVDYSSGALAAAQRIGLDLGDTRPRPLDDNDLAGQVIVIAMCDRAHEELHAHDGWLHWSIPDPVDVGTEDAFDAALAEIDERIVRLTAPTNRGEHAPA
jgi:protein-tyrosine-phosphatase